jgi:hypothetical protein
MPQQKLNPSGVFCVEGKATPMHDDMLFHFTKSSERLKAAILKYGLTKNERVEDVIKKLKTPIKVYVVTDINSNRQAFRDKPKIIKHNEKIYQDIEDRGICDCSKWDYRCDREGNLLDTYKKEFDKDLIDKKIIEIESIVEIMTIVEILEIVNIVDWHPEKAIIKNDSYYVGSVDLYVDFEVVLTINLKILGDWKWNKYDVINLRGSIAFEFKPEIKSYSEVIRQVNVYRALLPAGYMVITNSDVTKFKDIFQERGIILENL